MKSLLIVAHAPSKNTEALLDGVVQGAKRGLCAADEEIRLDVRSPFDTEARHVQRASALILGTPENLGYMSGALKDFFDRIYNTCLETTRGLPYALYVRAGHDGTGTRRAVEGITGGLGWRAVSEPLLCRGVFEPSFVAACDELGEAMIAGLDAGIF